MSFSDSGAQRVIRLLDELSRAAGEPEDQGGMDIDVGAYKPPAEKPSSVPTAEQIAEWGREGGPAC